MFISANKALKVLFTSLFLLPLLLSLFLALGNILYISITKVFIKVAGISESELIDISILKLSYFSLLFL